MTIDREYWRNFPIYDLDALIVNYGSMLEALDELDAKDKTLAERDREIDLLNKLRVQLAKDSQMHLDKWQECRAENERLRGHGSLDIDRMRRDAERYRWLRSHGWEYSNGFYSLSFYLGSRDGGIDMSFDEAIDAAREGDNE